MPLFALKNLGTLAVTPDEPWNFDKLALVPENCIKNKKARTDWMLNPHTNFNAYSGFEGVNGNQRVKSGSGSEEGNPPLMQHAFVADVDFPLSETEVRAAVARMSPQPNWIERSLSGNWRFLWLFEKPVMMCNYDFAVFWLGKLDTLIPFRQVAGVDDGAVNAPERYYTNGCKWEKIHDVPIPHVRLLGQLQEVSAKYNWQGSDLGISVPLDIAATELKKRYPRFNEWEEFTLDSQGPTFWIDGSESPKSAVVRATGIQTFSGHATKPFYNWSELLGHEFVRQFKLEEMGRAIDGIYYDGRSYIRQNGNGDWLWNDKEGVSLHLRVTRGLSDRRAKGLHHSPIDSAITAIQDTALVTSAGSFAGYEKGLMKYNGNRYLNIHNKDAVAPAGEPAVWGPGGNLPFISTFLDGFFSSPDQLPFFLAWLARFYVATHKRDPRSGQACFVFGPPNRGKTFLSTGIVSPLFSGHSDARDFLMGSDSFNSEMFEFSVWTVDDGSNASSNTMLHYFSEMVKKVVADKSFRSNEKFRKAGMVRWQGRAFITGNLDPESLRRIPNLDISMKEKIMLFKVLLNREDGFKFPDEGEIRAKVSQELPFLARFLLDYVPEAQCLAGDNRYGVKEYHEASLLSEANHSSVSGTFGEILDEWQREHFMVREPQATEWVGTALQLHKSVLSDMSMTEAMRSYNVQAVSRMLCNLATRKVFDIQITGDEHRRLFTIKRDHRFPRSKSTQFVAANSQTNFTK